MILNLSVVEYLNEPVPGAPTITSRSDEEQGQGQNQGHNHNQNQNQGQGQGQNYGQGQGQNYNAPQSMAPYGNNQQQQVIQNAFYKRSKKKFI